jgi:hypothetical protein
MFTVVSRLLVIRNYEKFSSYTINPLSKNYGIEKNHIFMYNSYELYENISSVF